MPFLQVDVDEPAVVVLAQVADRRFRLVEPFRYVGPSGTWVVTPADLATTDLASVPWFLRWFASGYGRHTLAALLHDHLVDDGDGDAADAGRRAEPPVDRVTADRVFLEALAQLDVPVVRRRLMWAAVTLATRFRAPGVWPAVGVVLWGVAAVVGTTALAVAVREGNVGLALAAAVGPVPFAVLWGREVVAGLLAGYAVAIVGLPTVAILFGYAAYWVTEQAVRGLSMLRPANRGADLPHPTPYREL